MQISQKELERYLVQFVDAEFSAYQNEVSIAYRTGVVEMARSVLHLMHYGLPTIQDPENIPKRIPMYP